MNPRFFCIASIALICLAGAARAADPAGFDGGGASASGAGFRMEGGAAGWGLPGSAMCVARGVAFKIELGDFAARQTRALANGADPAWDQYVFLYPRAEEMLRPRLRLAALAPTAGARRP